MKLIEVPLDGSGLRIGIVAGRFNDFVSNSLLTGACARLVSLGVADADIHVAWVAGAFEVPLAARAMAESGRYDAVVCLGAVIRGETPHFDYVAGEAAAGIMRAGHDTGVPVVFGVLTTDTVEQALERADVDRGEEDHLVERGRHRGAAAVPLGHRPRGGVGELDDLAAVHVAEQVGLRRVGHHRQGDPGEGRGPRFEGGHRHAR